MRHLAILALLATPLAAQSPPPGHPGPGRGSLFISPFGEPIRGADSREAAAARWFAGADADRDGRVTLAELKADASRFFAALDVDHDGEIGPAEIDRYENEVAPEIRVMAGGFGFGGHGGRGLGGRPPRGGGMGGPSGGGGMGRPRGGGGDGGEGPRMRDGDGERGPMRQGAGRFSWLEFPEPVMSADDNLNRGISPDEFERAAGRRFLLLDTKKQGYLSLDAMPPLPRRGGGPGGPPPGERRPLQPPPEE